MMSEKNVVAVYITDTNYAMITAVSIQSLKAHKNVARNYEVYVLENDITFEQKAKLEELSESGFEIIIKKVEKVNEEYATDKIHVTPVALTKFRLPEIFEDKNKILYLDSDTVIQRDVTEMYDTDIRDDYLAAVLDIGPLLTHKPSIKVKLKLERDTYFNSGVMVLNLKKMREDQVVPKLFDYKKNGINYFMDQDALNVVLGEKVKFLSMYYNFVITVFDKLDEKTIIDFYKMDELKSYKEYISKAFIIHMAGANKPWEKEVKYFSRIFEKYYYMSPYKNDKLILQKKSFEECLQSIKLEYTRGYLRKTKIGGCINYFIERRTQKEKLQKVLESYEESQKKIKDLRNRMEKAEKRQEGLKKDVERLRKYEGFVKKLKRVYSEGINRDKVQCEIDHFSELGICKEHRAQRIIVSLTSYIGRLYDVHFAIYSLMRQNLKPDAIILWLGKDDFPRGDEDLPSNIKKLKDNGLTIAYRDDKRSYTKLVYALQEFPNDIIVTADDDIYYPPNWLEKLYDEHLKNPEMILCHRIHKVLLDEDGVKSYKEWSKELEYATPSYLNFITGAGGALYPPHSLYKDVLRDDIYKKYVPLADDIWFWAMAVLNGTKIGNVPECINKLQFVNIVREVHLNEDDSLSKDNNVKDMNSSQMNQLLKVYPDLLKKCRAEEIVD